MIKIESEAGEEMTLVIGANCKDGVVIIADKKVVEGVDVASQLKITLIPELWVGFSGAGLSSMFDKFMARTSITLEERKRNIRLQMKTDKPDVTEDELNKVVSPYLYANQFVEDCEGILMVMKQNYKEIVEKFPNSLQLLFAFRAGNDAELHYMDIDGCLDSKRKTFIAIGSGSPYAQTFLKEIWTEDITMEEMARLGCFIINYIESSKLDNYVGEGVQILYVPRWDMRPIELIQKGTRTIEEEGELQRYFTRLENDGNHLFPKTKDFVSKFKQNLEWLKKEIKN